MDGDESQQIEKQGFLQETVTEVRSRPARKYHTPPELSTPLLLIYAALVLAVFVALQVSAAKFAGAAGLSPVAGTGQHQSNTHTVVGTTSLSTKKSASGVASTSVTLPSFSSIAVPGTSKNSRSNTLSTPGSTGAASAGTNAPTIVARTVSVVLDSTPSQARTINHASASKTSFLHPSSIRPSSGAPAPSAWVNPNGNVPKPQSTSSSVISVGAPAPSAWVKPDPKPSKPQSASSTILFGAPPAGAWVNNFIDASANSRAWESSYYFIGSYLPTIVAIILNTAWQCIFTRLKERQPFHQLTQKVDTRPEESLSLSYTTSNLVTASLSSLRSRHWLVALGSVNLLIIMLCTAFSSETLYITTVGKSCQANAGAGVDRSQDCYMLLAMRPVLAWTLGIGLFAIFAMTIALLWMLRRSRSGVFAEATSIAGIAALYSQSLGQDDSSRSVRTEKKYALVAAEDEVSGSTILPLADLVPPEHSPPSATKKTLFTGNPVMHPVALGLFFFFLAGIFIFVLDYAFVSRPGEGNGFETFMDSQTFGVSALMTSLGLAISLYWGAVEAHVRRMRPYLALQAANGATADDSILVRDPSSPLTALFYTDSWRHPLLAWTAFLTVLTQVLTITLSAVPFSVAETYVAFRVSVYICTVILVLMIVTVPIIWRNFSRKQKDFSEPPATIAETLALLSDDLGSRLSEVGGSNGKERDAIVRSWQCRYALRRVGEAPSRWQIVILWQQSRR